MLLTVAVSITLLALLGGLFCILLAGDFRHQTPLDMTHEQARTTSNLLIVVGGLLIVGAVILTPFAVKHLHPGSISQEPIATNKKSASAEKLDGPGLICQFCGSKRTKTSMISAPRINPLWKMYVFLLGFSLPLIILIFYIPTLFDELTHARGGDRRFGIWAMIVIPPLASMFLFGVLAQVLNISIARYCPSCKARWAERFSLRQFWKEITKQEGN